MSAEDVTYSMVMDVSNSWDRLKAVPDFENVAGSLIFSRVFEIEPKARNMFKYSADEDITANPTFAMHAKSMVNMIDGAVGFLGPDLEPLEEDLIELGKRHIRYGVKSEYLPIMCQAVNYTLKKVLGSSYTKQEQDSWSVVFNFMISKMTLGMELAIKKMTQDVTKSWKKLRDIPNFKATAGEIIIDRLFELEPKTEKLFMSNQSTSLLSSHTDAIIDMLDDAISMLGPDLEPLSNSLMRLGRRHSRYYNVNAEYLPLMGKAVNHGLAEVLGKLYTSSDRKSWETVLDFMVSKMASGMIRD